MDYFIYFHLFLKWGIADSADIGPYSQGYGLPGGHVQLWELDCKEGWAPKNWCLQTVVLEKTPETPLDSKELKPVNLKKNQPWLLTGRRLMLKLKLQYFGHLMQTANSSLMQHELGKTLRDGEEQGGLACCNPWGCKESDTAGRLNSNSDIAGAQYYMLQVYNIVIHNLSKLFSIILHL